MLAAFASSLLLATVAVAQTSTSSANTQSMSKNGGVATADRKFMDNASQGGMVEVELGQLAQQNGQSQEVKDFGKKMVDDHSKANDELKQFASQKGVSLSSGLNAKDKGTKARLERLKGTQFDQAYMKDRVTDHKKEVAEFEKESKSAIDPDVKSWARKTLPTLQEHLKIAEQDLASIQKESSNKSASAQ
jgi:putative membrane protein